MNSTIDLTSFAKNIILAEANDGNFQENKHKYFIDVMRDYSTGSFNYTGNLNGISVDDASIYNQNDMVFLLADVIGFADSDLLSGYFEISSVDYVNNKISLKDNGLFAKTNWTNETLNYTIGFSDRLIQTSNNNLGVFFEVNKIFKNYLKSRFNKDATTSHLVEGFAKNFKIVFGESYVYTHSLNSKSTFNTFYTAFNRRLNQPENFYPIVDDLKYIVNLSVGDGVIVSGTQDVWNNGIQEIESVNISQIISRKPNKTFTIPATESINLVRADNKPMYFYESSVDKSVINSGFKIDDLLNKTQVEIKALEDLYINNANKKFLTYAPRNQKTTINDEGYLYYYYDSASDGVDLIVRYDVDGVVHSYTLNPSESGVYAIPSNPKSINKNGNNWIDCDTKSYQVSVNNSEVFTYNLINVKRFNSARLIWNDSLGSYQGLTFTCKNVVNLKAEMTSFESESFDAYAGVRRDSISRGVETIESKTKKEYELQSDYVTEEVGIFLETLMASNDVMMQYDGGELFSVVLSSDTIEINEKADGLIQYKIKVKRSIYEN